MAAASSPRRWSHLWRLIDLLRPHRARFAIATVALLAGSSISLAYPQAVRYSIDLGIRGGSLEWLDRVMLIVGDTTS